MRAVHPRIRGEHRCSSADRVRASGSSPHTRGTRWGRGPADCPRRFIPAYAGNTAGTGARRLGCAVHPRIRGEHHAERMAGDQDFGSSPHTRGTLDELGLILRHPRFIPAYAGNTFARALGFSRDSGSSPHTRGTQLGSPSRVWESRFIPAYAGNTHGVPPTSTSGAVHPRIRGEHHARALLDLAAVGSSPHTRGTRGNGL